MAPIARTGAAAEEPRTRRRLEGRVVIVAGAGTSGGGMGNGKAAALAYARAGARVVAADIDETAAEETRNLVVHEGGECSVFAGDLSDAAAARDLFRAAQAAFGAVDVLHNNIGIFVPGGPEAVDEENWDRVFRVNLKTVFLTCRFALPPMLARGAGVITNVGSVSGHRFLGLPQIAYSTSKAAIEAFTRGVAAEYGPRGIRANTVVAGVIDTPVLSRAAGAYAAISGSAGAEELRRAREGAIPLRRYGAPEDVASAAVFLASDEARYVTGASLVVDGGLLCLGAGAAGSV